MNGAGLRVLSKLDAKVSAGLMKAAARRRWNANDTRVQLAAARA
jgi:hypothetical protein